MSSQFYSSQQKFQAQQLSSYLPDRHYQTSKTNHRTEQQTEAENIQTFRIQIGMIAPLLERLHSQNNQLFYQKQFLAQELGILAETSDHLTKQNQQLMAHFKMRSDDLGKLTKTIMINNNQKFHDISQGISLYSAGNSQIVKDLQTKIKQQKELTNQIQELKQLIIQESIKKSKLQDHYLKLKTKNLENTKNIQRVQPKINSHQRNELEKEINEIVLAISKIKENNLGSLRAIKQKRQEVDVLNPQAVYWGVKQSVEKLRKFQEQKDSLQINLQRIQDNKIREEKMLQNTNKKLKEIQSEWGRKIYILNDSNERLQINNNRIAHKKMMLIQNREKIEKKQYEANKLKILIANKKLNQQRKKSLHLSRLNDIRSRYNKQIQKLKKLVNFQLHNQLTSIAQEKREIQFKINELKKQSYILDEELSSYGQSIATESNPVGEILAYEHTLFRNNKNRF